MAAGTGASKGEKALPCRFAFAYLTLNGDAHAKNVSVLREPDGEWRAAPAYVGLTRKAVGKALDRLIERVPTWMDRLEELPFDERVIQKLRRAAQYRVERLSG